MMSDPAVYRWVVAQGDYAAAGRRAVLWAVTFNVLAVVHSTQAQEVAGLQAAIALQQALVQAIARGEKSVVAIARVRKIERRGGGSRLRPNPPDPTDPEFIPNEFATGVVVDPRGLILTNYHVLGEVDQCEYYVATSEHKVYKALRVKAADPWSDLAILELDAADLVPITFANLAAKGLKKGQIVITLGNPYAIARDGQVSAGWGIISNLTRKAVRIPKQPSEPNEPTMHHYGTLIQTDAKLNLGTSGGALLNLNGEMIGLTTSLAALSGYEKPAGFAIPVDATFLRIVQLLKAGHEVEYGFLGVGPENLAAEEHLRGRHGARVREIVQGTPAARSSLNRGDVITQIDGQRVYDVDGLLLGLGRLPVERVARLTIDRDGLVFHADVKLSKKSPSLQRRAIVTAKVPTWRGIRVDYSTALPGFKGLDVNLDAAGYVAVTAVNPDSDAWKAGLRPGQFISHVEEIRVSTPKQFLAAVGQRQGRVRLRFAGPTGDGRTHGTVP